MNVMRSRFLKGTLTVLGAVVFSTLGIFASDALQGIDRNFSHIAGVGGTGVCKAGTVPLTVNGGVLCADMYEASPSSKCPNQKPTNILDSERNTNAPDCYAASVEGVEPWTFVSLTQAQRMCAGAGKRLPTSDEWYRIALGTAPDSCIVNSTTPQRTGTKTCRSSIGGYDLVGNVWEWVDETVIGNTYEERLLPSEGYIASVDASGVAITSDSAPQELYGEDYFWSKQDGVFGMIRGGFYGSGSDAGLYTINASVSTAFATQGVGFRCVEDAYKKQ
jgi:formylglycine-generating enzyme required for sulfatase activity